MSSNIEASGGRQESCQKRTQSDALKFCLSHIDWGHQYGGLSFVMITLLEERQMAENFLWSTFQIYIASTATLSCTLLVGRNDRPETLRTARLRLVFESRLFSQTEQKIRKGCFSFSGER